MSDYLLNLCGVYSKERSSRNPQVAVEYRVELITDDGRRALRISTKYADGHFREEILHVDPLDETDYEIVDQKLRVLEKLRHDWDFSPEFGNSVKNEIPERAYVFSVEDEVGVFFNDRSWPAEDRPEFVVIVGPVCAGKSTLRRQRYPDHVLIDAGIIFQNLSRGEFFHFGEAFEEPLELIGRELARRAIAERRNVVTEMIGVAVDVKGALRDMIVAAGYQPQIVVVYCDLETAHKRNLRRGDNISAHFCEPYHFRWISKALEDHLSLDDDEFESNVEDPYFDRAFFPIREDESFVKYELINFLRKVIGESDVSSDKLRKLALLMLAFERLPRTTKGLNVEFGIKLETGTRNNSVYALELSEDRFSIYYAGYVFTEGVGGDSHSDLVFECESSGYRDGSFEPMDLADWMLGALELLESGADIEIDVSGDESLIELESDDDGFDELEERIRLREG